MINLVKIDEIEKKALIEMVDYYYREFQYTAYAYGNNVRECQSLALTKSRRQTIVIHWYELTMRYIVCKIPNFGIMECYAFMEANPTASLISYVYKKFKENSILDNTKTLLENVQY